ncbi:hypothetical protein Tco_0322612 [Tanacetum coccineum]
MMVQANQEAGVDSGIPTDPQQPPITTQPSSSRPQKKQSRRKQRKETEVPQDETHHDDSVLIPSHDPLLSGKGCSSKGDCWFKEVGPKVGKEKKKSRTTGLKRLRKVGESKRVASSEDKESLGAQEYASKQGGIFEEFDKDVEVSLVDEYQGRLDDAEMFDTDDLYGDEVIMDMAVGEKQEQSAKVVEREVSTGVEDSVAPTISVTTAGKGVITAIDELILAQTVIEIKPAKPKAITTAATTTTTTRPKARGVVVQEPSEFRTTTSSPQASQPSKTKDKGKSIMIEPEVPLKKKDQVAATTTTTTRPKARGVEVQEPIPLKKKDQVALDEEMARNLEAQLQAKLIKEEKMARKKEEEANIALIESWENTQAMMEFKKAKIALDSSTKEQVLTANLISLEQKTDENEEVKVDNEAELKMHMVIVKDDDIAIDAIPLGTKPPMIVEYKLIKEGIIGHYQLIRADGSSKRYSSMIRMLQGIDREDLQTLWKLVKTKHGDIRPEDEHERVLWGDLKVMFEPDIKSDVWRNLQGYKVTNWKLFDSCGVHFVRFGNVHIFMLVEKRYPLTPITITNMLNKKLQADYWNEMCYQLLKLMVAFDLLRDALSAIFGLSELKDTGFEQQAVKNTSCEYLRQLDHPLFWNTGTTALVSGRKFRGFDWLVVKNVNTDMVNLDVEIETGVSGDED